MEEHCASLRTQLASVVDVVASLVKTDFPAGTGYIPPKGGFIHWLELPGDTDMAALEKLAGEQGCHVVGSSIFFPDRRASTGLRICLGGGGVVGLGFGGGRGVGVGVVKGWGWLGGCWGV